MRHVIATLLASIIVGTTAALSLGWYLDTHDDAANLLMAAGIQMLMCL